MYLMIKKRLLLFTKIHWSISISHSKNCSTSSFKMPKTAGIIIIGDEILKGQTPDSNSFDICKTLHAVGVHVKKIAVIGDDLNTIASEVKKFSSNFDYVLTSGGIGPTHDDLTLEGIARAFEEQLIPHPTLVELCTKYFGPKNLSSPEMKLATVPASTVLHFAVDKLKGETFKFPLISVKNVYIFPGIPVLLRRLLDNLNHLFASEDRFHSEVLLVNSVETEIASILSSCAEKFKDAGITIGSYPDWFNNYYKVKVVIESANKDATITAANYLKGGLSHGCLIEDFVKNPLALRGKDVFGSTIREKFPMLYQKIQHSTKQSYAATKEHGRMSILEDALKQYPGNAICIGFNGGKDCTALLHLYYAVLCRDFPDSTSQLQAIYIKDKHPFEELETFMVESVKRYKLDLISLEGQMKEALKELCNKRPNIKAVVMGTRCTDPYSKNLNSFSPTDGDWPEFMRINPILNWTYHDIWIFLRTLHLPYCVLYDRGYTSLGSRERTKRNEKLTLTGNDGKVYFAPAYTLENEDLERNGRL